MTTCLLRWLSLIAGILLIVASGGACSRSELDPTAATTRAELETKLNAVLQQMAQRCSDVEDLKALQAAQLFQNIEGLSMDLVGFTVPINSGSNRAHLSFTLEHFRQTPSEVLAVEALKDLQSAKVTSGQGSDR